MAVTHRKCHQHGLATDVVPAGAQSSCDMEITSVMVPQRRHAPVLRVRTTLVAMRRRYSSISSAESPDFREMHGVHKGCSMMSVAMSAAFPGISLSPSHRGQFYDASASIAVAPPTSKAWFSADGGCGRPCVCKADLEVKCQAVVAIREWILEDQKLSDLHHGVRREPTVPIHTQRPLPIRIAALESRRGVSRRWTPCAFTKPVVGKSGWN